MGKTMGAGMGKRRGREGEKEEEEGRVLKIRYPLQGQNVKPFWSRCNCWETSTNHQISLECAAGASNGLGACTAHPRC